jgi:predicted DNA-binding transcriptional regulator AlpA
VAESSDDARQRPEVVAIAGVAEILGVTRQRADILSRQKGFPEPLPLAAGGDQPRVWLADEVREWAAKRATGSP